MRGVSVFWVGMISAVLGCESSDGATGSTDAAGALADATTAPSDAAVEPDEVQLAVDTAGPDDAGPEPEDVAPTQSDLGMEEDIGAPDAGAPDTAEEPDAGEPDVEDGPDAPDPDVTACTAACDGLECGPDGCGGECGACADGEVCTLGLCSTPGACTNEADGGVLASIDVAAKVEGCAKGCVLEADKAACGGNCLAKETGLSAGCAACFGGNVACAFTKCTLECGFGSAEKCLECQTTAGCFVAFEACAGLLPP